MSTRINPNTVPDLLAAMETVQQNAQNAAQAGFHGAPSE